MSADYRDDDLLRDDYPRARPKGFAPWKPRTRRAAILADVQAVLAENADYLPLTNRQVLYRCIGRWPSRYSKADEQAIEDVVQRGRRAGYISWAHIEDGRSVARPPFEFADEDAFRAWVVRQADRAQLPRQDGQPCRVELHVETVGLLPQLERVAHPYGVSVFSSSGTATTTAVYRTFMRAWAAVRADLDAGRPVRVTEVLHVADLDWKGVELFNTFRLDVAAMSADRGLPGLVEVRRVALLPSQVTRFGLETEPLTEKDAKHDWPEDRPKAQVEALAPADLAAEIEDALDDLLNDAQARDEVEAAEEEFRQHLAEAFGDDDEEAQ